MGQQAHAEHRIEHVDLHAQGDAQRTDKARAPAEQVTVSGHHCEVRPRTDDGKDGDKGNGDQFGHGSGGGKGAQ
ncbi:hypothetical protein G6F31_021869 [Rhizopus arrhizus]|nr:hypothetical protein G6F31_021869 [Rhizopus arrhizus]